MSHRESNTCLSILQFRTWLAFPSPWVVSSEHRLHLEVLGFSISRIHEHCQRLESSVWKTVYASALSVFKFRNSECEAGRGAWGMQGVWTLFLLYQKTSAVTSPDSRPSPHKDWDNENKVQELFIRENTQWPTIFKGRTGKTPNDLRFEKKVAPQERIMTYSLKVLHSETNTWPKV